MSTMIRKNGRQYGDVFTAMECEHCGEFYEPDRSHICKKINSYPMNEPTSVEVDISQFRFCDNCEHLSPTENEQRQLKMKEHLNVHHMCQKYKVRVMHLGFHPHIVPCEQCQKDMIREEGIS